jgi:hypothetical protein
LRWRLLHEVRPHAADKETDQDAHHAMTRPMDVSAAIASVSHGMTVLNALKDAMDARGDAEVKMQIAELTAAFADAKAALAAAKLLMDERDNEIARLLRSLRRHDEAIEVNGLRYPKGRDGNAQGFPYCPRCLEVDGHSIQCQFVQGTVGAAVCPQCKTRYPIHLHAPLMAR